MYNSLNEYGGYNIENPVTMDELYTSYSELSGYEEVEIYIDYSDLDDEGTCIELVRDARRFARETTANALEFINKPNKKWIEMQGWLSEDEELELKIVLEDYLNEDDWEIYYPNH